MRIVVDSASVVVEEPDDLNRLAVVSRVGAEHAIARLIQTGLAAPFSAEHADGPNVVWLDAVELRARAFHSPGMRSTDWARDWEVMIAFADQHGWMREGTQVRAHIDDES